MWAMSAKQFSFRSQVESSDVQISDPSALLDSSFVMRLLLGTYVIQEPMARALPKGPLFQGGQLIGQYRHHNPRLL
jgi:hypothetical protein